MNLPIEQTLQRLGFSRNEARVYVAALETGVSSAQEIAKRAKLKRTTTYSILDYLVQRGVVGKTELRGKARFLADPPSKLLSLLEDIHSQIKKELPQLEALYNKHETKPKIVFYEGKGAVQKVYDDTLLEKPKEILEWNTNEYFKFDQYRVDPTYIAKRMHLGIRARRLAGSGSQWHVKHKKYDASELSETIIVPKEVFWPEIEVNIYGNKVAFLNYTEEMSLIIESRAIADAMKQAYELSWRGAKTVEVKE
ncbi:hypothetical protein HY624_00790 [Candidatus Uhrbacteria bacterium]|nr:hypothetical protein [Candidatus Uhrbacteria bacterium]